MPPARPMPQEEVDVSATILSKLQSLTKEEVYRPFEYIICGDIRSTKGQLGGT